MITSAPAPHATVHKDSANWLNGASLRGSGVTGEPVWTHGHDPAPCRLCRKPTSVRSPGGNAWCGPACRSSSPDPLCGGKGAGKSVPAAGARRARVAKTHASVSAPVERDEDGGGANGGGS